jgi:hypothetical protein
MIRETIPPRTCALQDQRVADRIAAALDAGLALQQVAQQAFNAPRRLWAARKQAASALKQARVSYAVAAFQETGRERHPGRAGPHGRQISRQHSVISSKAWKILTRDKVVLQ